MAIVKNVLGENLQTCCTSPMTGFYRDGTCNTGPNDMGSHVVCAEMTEEFLTYTKAQGNGFEYSCAHVPVSRAQTGGSLVPMCGSLARSL